MTNDEFTLRIDKSIKLVDLANAFEGIGYTLTADDGGLRVIPKDGRKRRKRRSAVLEGTRTRDGYFLSRGMEDDR